ncbi:hypothetical protein GBA52_010951 [Prunus armeniaca]|nr:hypothetical protein GBA52_010951 [Prunus armeniaca]
MAVDFTNQFKFVSIHINPDINECELPDRRCSEHFICVNSAGGYRCYPPKSNSQVKVIFIGMPLHYKVYTL